MDGRGATEDSDGTETAGEENFRRADVLDGGNGIILYGV